MATWTDPSAAASGPGDVTPAPRRARSEGVPHPYERHRDREFDRDELTDLLIDREAGCERFRVSAGWDMGEGYW